MMQEDDVDRETNDIMKIDASPHRQIISTSLLQYISLLVALSECWVKAMHVTEYFGVVVSHVDPHRTLTS